MQNRLAAVLALACALLTSTAATARHRRGPCVPVFIEGAGTVWICGARPSR